jgi:hypothetical protein
MVDAGKMIDLQDPVFLTDSATLAQAAAAATHNIFAKPKHWEIRSQLASVFSTEFISPA